MLIRIQVKKIAKLILFIEVEKKIIFKSVTKLYGLVIFLGSDLEKYNFLRKSPKTLLDKVCFSLHFIPHDPDPESKCGSGSTDPNECGSDRIYITDKNVRVGPQKKTQSLEKFSERVNTVDKIKVS